jgi:hypothetical protein
MASKKISTARYVGHISPCVSKYLLLQSMQVCCVAPRMWIRHGKPKFNFNVNLVAGLGLGKLGNQHSFPPQATNVIAIFRTYRIQCVRSLHIHTSITAISKLYHLIPPTTPASAFHIKIAQGPDNERECFLPMPDSAHPLTFPSR